MCGDFLTFDLLSAMRSVDAARVRRAGPAETVTTTPAEKANDATREGDVCAGRS